MKSLVFISLAITTLFSIPSFAAAPSDLSIVDAGFATGNNCYILVSWSDGSNDESGFEIQFKPNGEHEWITIGSADADATSARIEHSYHKKHGLYRVAALPDLETSEEVHGYCTED